MKWANLSPQHRTYPRSDEERDNLKSELDAVNQNFEAISKQKQGLDKTCRMLDEQLGDSNSKREISENNLRDLSDKYTKLVLMNFNELLLFLAESEAWTSSLREIIAGKT